MENKTILKSKSDEENIKILSEWNQKQPHLPKDFDDDLLLSFIRGTKSIEIAKQKLDAFCTLRTKSPQYFTFPNRDPLDAKFKKSCDGNMFFLPKPTPEGYRILMADFSDFSKYDSIRHYIRMSMVLEVALTMWSESNGIVMVFDAKNVDSSLFTKMSMPATLFMIQYTQSTLPMKMKKTIVINAPSFGERFMNTFVKPYMSKKLADRVVLTSQGREKLKDLFPVDLLPCDMPGGTARSSDELNAEWKRILEARRDWFLKSSLLCTDESKRPPDKAQTYGIDGTFRVLSVD